MYIISNNLSKILLIMDREMLSKIHRRIGFDLVSFNQLWTEASRKASSEKDNVKEEDILRHMEALFDDGFGIGFDP